MTMSHDSHLKRTVTEGHLKVSRGDEPEPEAAPALKRTVTEGHLKKTTYATERAAAEKDVDKWFGLLRAALEYYHLPAGGKYRKSDAGEFMLMDVVSKHGVKQAHFKHRKSRNYLIVTAGGQLVVPKGGAFAKGDFPEGVEADGDELTEAIESPSDLAGFLTAHARDLNNRIKNLKAGRADAGLLESLETTLQAMRNGVDELRKELGIKRLKGWRK